MLPSFDHLQQHMKNCKNYDIKASNNEKLQCHMVKEHDDIIILHSIAKQVDNIQDEIVKEVTLKRELSQILKLSFDNQEKFIKKLSKI